MPKHIHTPPLRPLYSLNGAAAIAGITPEILTTAIQHGDIPGVRILQLGPRKLRYVRSHPFIAWLEGVEPPTDRGPDADRAAEIAVDDEFSDTEYLDDLFNPT